MQNDATGCGNIFHTRQTQFWELHFLTFWTDISIFDRHLTFMDQPICHGSWDQTIPPKLLTGRPVNNLGIVDSSQQGPGPRKQGPGPRSQNPNSVGTSCQSSHSPTHPILLFPHQGAGEKSSKTFQNSGVVYCWHMSFSSSMGGDGGGGTTPPAYSNAPPTRIGTKMTQA